MSMLEVDFPATREAAFVRLAEFSAVAKRYAGARNFVRPGHDNVSRLSAAIRHRLISEEEVVSYMLGEHSFSSIEKFLQEVFWRTYWKGWLAQHSGVWSDAVGLAKEEPNKFAKRVMEGASGCAVMDDFTIELIDTGYLHNHARMWWAAFWVHHLGLPWAQGADFFLRYLLDADAASNTLSWRWVAGLHTAGKSYIARPDNIARYHPEHRDEGLAELATTKARIPADHADTRMHALPTWPTAFVLPHGGSALLLHADDLSIETTALSSLRPREIVMLDLRVANDSIARNGWLNHAMDDACDRAEAHFGQAVKCFSSAAEVADYVRNNQQLAWFGMAPNVGHLGDAVVDEGMMEACEVTWLQRPWDAQFYPAARSGFFSFWKKISGTPLFVGK